MSIQKQILKSVETILLTAGLCAAATAQTGAGPKKPLGVSLEDDIRWGPTLTTGHASAFSGAVMDGGSVSVDVGVDERLTLTLENRGLTAAIRLAGGTPGSAGAILVSLREPAQSSTRLASNAAVIGGAFGMDGSFVIELPLPTEEVFVQGIEATPIGGAASGIRKLVPSGQLLEVGGPTWQTTAISDAVRGALAGSGQQLVRMRFHGPARMAGIHGFADVTVVFGRDPAVGKGVAALYIGPALAQRTALVESGGELAVGLHFQSAAGIVGAIERLVLLDAFAGVEVELEWARAQLAAQRIRPGIGLPRCGTPHEPGFGAAAGDAVAIPGTPRRAGAKQPLPERKVSGAGRFQGTLGDAGSVTVVLPQSEAFTTDWDVIAIGDAPRRAGAKEPFPEQKVGAAGYSGPLGDAGSRTVFFKPSPALSFDKARRTVESLASVARTLDLLRSGLGSGGHTSPR